MDKIKGHTYMIMGGTNTGVFAFRDGSTLLIDPGHSKARGRRLVKILEENKLRTRYCYATHEHMDHFEAYFSIKEENPSVDFLCNEYARIFFEQLYLGNMIMYGAIPNKMLGELARPFTTYIENLKSLVEGRIKINDKEFMLIHTPGHTMGAGSIMTEDKVIFVGDSIFDERILDKYKIPFIVDTDRFEASLDKLERIDFDFGVIAHSKTPYTKAEISKIIKINKDKIYELRTQVYELLSTPYSREELLKDLMILHEVEVNPEIYHYNNATVGSLLSGLIAKDEITYSVEDGRIIYYR
ncbi:MAG: MBL fold metallo-hydrolase [Filifactoraceae bacterium]